MFWMRSVRSEAASSGGDDTHVEGGESLLHGGGQRQEGVAERGKGLFGWESVEVGAVQLFYEV